jgi:hypothetical protein
MSVTWIEPHPAYKHLLGRSVVNHDPANWRYLALERTTRPPQTHPGRGWPRHDVFDQRDSNCTIEAFTGLLHMTPFRANTPARRAWPQLDTEDERISWYKLSQAYDPWEGNNYDGTSTDAPYKLAMAQGWIPGFHWLMGEEQLWEWVTLYGPASVGTKWLKEMLNPDANGFLTCTGPSIGGHEWDVIKADQHGQFYDMVNSWGTGWGKNGRARITRTNMRALLDDDGDAVTIGA